MNAVIFISFLFIIAGFSKAQQEKQQCHGPHDSSCSPSYTCVQFPDLKFYCHPTLKLCPRGLPALVGMDKPIFCQGSTDTRTCPQKTHCMAVTTNPSVHICCEPEAETGAGPQGVYQQEYGQQEFGADRGAQTPYGKGPQQATQYQQAYGGFEQQHGPGWCPSDMTPQLTGFGNEPQHCMGLHDTTSCQVGSTCVLSPRVPNKFVCCCRGCSINPQDVCPNSGLPAMVGAKPVECGGCQDRYSCPRGTSCLNSPKSPGKFFCCGPPQKEPTTQGRRRPLSADLFEEEETETISRGPGFEGQNSRRYERGADMSETYGQEVPIGRQQPPHFGSQFSSPRSGAYGPGQFGRMGEEQFGGRVRSQQTHEMPFEGMGPEAFGPYQQRRTPFGSESVFAERPGAFMGEQPWATYGREQMMSQHQPFMGFGAYGRQPFMDTHRRAGYGTPMHQQPYGTFPRYGAEIGGYMGNMPFTPYQNPLFTGM